MYRLIKMSNKIFALKIHSIEDDIENIEEFIDNGDAVIICNSLETAADIFNISENEIEIINKYGE